MALSKKHIDRVLNVSGYAFVDPEEVPHLTQRYTESYIRRRAFYLEDEAVVEEYGMFEATYKRMRQAAFDLAMDMGMDTLANDGPGVEYRREVLFLFEEQLRVLADDVAKHAYNAVVNGYLLSWYGKLWMLDSMTRGDVVNIPRIGGDEASMAVLQKQILEAVADGTLYEIIGQEWDEQYQTEIDELMLRTRRRVSAGMGLEESIQDLMLGIALLMGIDAGQTGKRLPDMKATFNRVQGLTRSYFINANNDAARGVYSANPDVVRQVMFVTANDERVCSVCAGYRGMRWDINDPGIVHPVVNTHKLCRCSLIPIVYEDVSIVDPTEPPNVDFDSWLANYGIGFLAGLGVGVNSSRD